MILLKIVPIVICLLLVNCSYLFQFRIIGKIESSKPHRNLRIEVKTEEGSRLDDVRIRSVNNDSITIDISSLNLIPKTLTIYIDESAFVKTEFLFDRKTRVGFIYSPTTGQKVTFKKSRDANGDRLYIAEGFVFK